jgi:hypothetical protein
MRTQQIKALAAQRAIPFLVHFTRIENLGSIIQHGLLPRTAIAAQGVPAIINDPERWDGRLAGTSTSIGFPNGQMLWRLRNDNPGSEWVHLIIEPSVLWTHDVLFCRHNAADGRISCLPDAVLRHSKALNGLFEEIEGHQSRADQGLKPYDPTDVQAEALVLEPISPGLVAGVVFHTKAARDESLAKIGNRRSFVHPGRKGFFANRTYFRKYGGG